MMYLWSALMILLVGCGRVGFDAAAEGQDGVSGSVDHGGTSNARCATARTIPADAFLVHGTMVNAQDQLDPPLGGPLGSPLGGPLGSPSGCGDGPEVALRFAGPARHIDLHVLAEFGGSYTLGTGCPVGLEGATFQCGPLQAGIPSSTLGLDVDEHTYLIIDWTSGAASTFDVLLTDGTVQ